MIVPAVLFSVLTVAGAGPSSPPREQSVCNLIEILEVDLKTMDADDKFPDGDVCQGGWIIWKITDPDGGKIKVKLKNWKFYGGSRKADVTKFKKFGSNVFDDGAEDETAATARTETTAVLVARVYYQDLKDGESQKFRYTVSIKRSGAWIDYDPEIEIQDPPTITPGKK